MEREHIEQDSYGHTSHCWFCGARWGEDRCDWPDYTADGNCVIPPDADGFEWQNFFISMPNVSANTIDFVNPSIYYGMPFVKWWENHPKNPTPCDGHCRERVKCRHDIWRTT